MNDPCPSCATGSALEAVPGGLMVVSDLDVTALRAVLPPLAAAWQLLLTPPGAIAAPAALPDVGGWIPAPVPGTLATALAAAGAGLRALDGSHLPADVWYRCTMQEEGHRILRFAGLTAPAEVWLDGALLRRAHSMFVTEEVEATLQPGMQLALCFRDLRSAVALPSGRARWRPRLTDEPRLRRLRTTMLGHMPGWCPPVPPVGPWRPVSCHDPRRDLVLRRALLRTRLEGTDGVLEASLEVDGLGEVEGVAELHIAGSHVALHPAGDGRLTASLRLPGIAPWWPHTHGTPSLHAATAVLGGRSLALGRVGFRSIVLDHGADGSDFGLLVNGERVFCRGASWTSASLADLPDGAPALRPWLELAREAGMNMIRVSGTTIYEADAFYALCDELGLMVWQDAMFATLDYPDDAEFLAEARRELEQFLARTSGNACLALLCGSTERVQSATMRGLPPSVAAHPLFDQEFPAAITALRPELAYIPDAPCGGVLPFDNRTGVSHYYGVGAYLRPLEDARRADVRFAAECLALANVADASTLAALPRGPTSGVPWQAGVPRDPGTSWDFAEVRDHYLQLLYGVPPAMLRAQNPSRYLSLSRAVSADLMEAVFAEWRRPASSCAGGLVWQLQDLQVGAGWGVVDALGRPKAAWHGLRRVLAPLQLLFSDEAMDGLDLHLLNETPRNRHLRVELCCLQHGEQIVAQAEREVLLPARGSLTFNAAALLGRFFDTTYAYRFGPPPHDVVVGLLRCADTGALLSQAVHFPLGRALPAIDAGLTATLHQHNGNWQLHLRAERFVQAVHFDIPGFRGAEEWFHLPPREDRRVSLLPDNAVPGISFSDVSQPPAGEVLALNMLDAVRCSVSDGVS